MPAELAKEISALIETVFGAFNSKNAARFKSFTMAM